MAPGRSPVIFPLPASNEPPCAPACNGPRSATLGPSRSPAHRSRVEGPHRAGRRQGCRPRDRGVFAAPAEPVLLVARTRDPVVVARG
ncbi:hypothetical protein ACS04_01905 [Streptomyces roseus]|uniref:Uncharacterized protein n=1 Tax=Streptomyces roseus TaxID=66430 RepID=A0A0J6XYT6_9ACTN|nr:hypothetical protein ACS04_01905 [Streptomyces roseus]